MWATELALKVLCKCDSQAWKPVAAVNGNELLVSLRAKQIKGEWVMKIGGETQAGLGHF